MQLDAAVERDMLRSSIREFMARRVAPNMAEWEATGEIPRWVQEEAGDAGFLGMGWPEEVGGSGGDFSHLLLLSEELCKNGGSSGFCTGLLTHTIAIPHIAKAGNPDQIERWVRPTLAGRMVGGLAVTEPDAGSDVASIRTRAERDGDHYVVNGAKTFITSSVRGDFVTAAVRTGGPGYGGISLLVVEKGTPGFEVSRKLDKMGWRCSDTGELTFTDCRVPVENLVGPENTGFTQIMRQFQSERLWLAAQAHATAQRCLELTIEWCRNRRAFGGPLTDKQVIRHRLAEMARQTDVARVYTDAVAARWIAGEDVTLEVSMAKNTAVYACDYVTHEAVQLHGGMGYMRETEVERHYRDARLLGIGGGTNEIMNEVIAKRLGLC